MLSIIQGLKQDGWFKASLGYTRKCYLKITHRKLLFRTLSVGGGMVGARYPWKQWCLCLTECLTTGGQIEGVGPRHPWFQESNTCLRVQQQVPLPTRHHVGKALKGGVGLGDELSPGWAQEAEPGVDAVM